MFPAETLGSDRHRAATSSQRVSPRLKSQTGAGTRNQVINIVLWLRVCGSLVQQQQVTAVQCWPKLVWESKLQK